MKISGWGHFPVIDAEVEPLYDNKRLSRRLGAGFSGIAHALGRSYGDSALAPQVLLTRHLDNILAFNKRTGVVTCQAGVSLEDLLSLFVPRGWFLPITPGTKFVTLGGAIASDVHGKNHHHDGCFSTCVQSLKLMLADGSVKECSQQKNQPLFHATCGGMGLTGIILEARIQLRPITSAQIDETTFKAQNLDDVLDLFEQHQGATYSVAWIDCLARGKKLGRSLLMLGEHCETGELALDQRRRWAMPVHAPGFLLNHHSIAAFNHLYYARVKQRESKRQVHYEPFFYPLDRIEHWNRMYGAKGFTQYQLVIPKQAGREGLARILKAISDSGRGSFLAVLKLLGKANDNLLSFPMEGYTLALDFKMEPGLLEFLDQLDDLVLDLGGRLYLTKDARMSERVFKQSYPQWEAFAELRESIGATGVFESLQSKRLGL